MPQSEPNCKTALPSAQQTVFAPPICLHGLGGCWVWCWEGGRTYCLDAGDFEIGGRKWEGREEGWLASVFWGNERDTST